MAGILLAGQPDERRLGAPGESEGSTPVHLQVRLAGHASYQGQPGAESIEMYRCFTEKSRVDSVARALPCISWLSMLTGSNSKWTRALYKSRLWKSIPSMVLNLFWTWMIGPPCALRVIVSSAFVGTSDII